MPGFTIGADAEGGPATLNPKSGRNRADWLRSHRFVLESFLGINSRNNNREIFALKDATLPDKKISDLKITTPGTTYKFAKSASYSDLKLSFYGSMSFLQQVLLKAELPHNISEGIGDYNTYKGIVKFHIYSPIDPSVGSRIQQVSSSLFSGDFGGVARSLSSIQYERMKYTYKNAWISEVKHGQMTYSSSDIKTIDVNIKFDFFEVVLDNGEEQTIVENNADTINNILTPEVRNVI